MKPTNLILVSLILIISFTACTTKEEPISPVCSSVNGSIDIREAQSRLVKILADPAIKSSFYKNSIIEIPNISNGRALDEEGNVLTRADMDQAAVYIFDIDTVGGYAIMGARPELPELIAICNGNANHEDYCQSEIVSALESLQDSIVISTRPGTGQVVDDGEETYWVRGNTTYRILSLYPNIDHAWGFKFPFNIAWYCANMTPTNQTPPTFCGNVALALLKIHPKHRWPNFDQSLFDNYRTQEQIANLLSRDPDGWLLKAPSYFIQGVSSYFPGFIYRQVCLFDATTIEENLKSGFALMDYRETGSLKSLDVDHIIEEISDNNPILMLCFRDHNYGNHIWLVPNVLVQERPMMEVGKKTGKIYHEFTATTYLLYCNWCLAGDYNGYYDTHLFTHTESDLDIHANMPTYIITTPDDKLNEYFSNVKIFSGMRRD